jgi:hemoglobin/transferrin/lactoferrin receptor protein
MASQAFAQEQKASEEEAGVALKTITIRRATDAQAPTSVTAPVGKVDREEINRFGGAKLDDVLCGTGRRVHASKCLQSGRRGQYPGF